MRVIFDIFPYLPIILFITDDMVVVRALKDGSTDCAELPISGFCNAVFIPRNHRSHRRGRETRPLRYRIRSVFGLWCISSQNRRRFVRNRIALNDYSCVPVNSSSSPQLSYHEYTRIARRDGKPVPYNVTSTLHKLCRNTIIRPKRLLK